MHSPISDALTELRRSFNDQLAGRLEDLRNVFQRLDPRVWQPGEAESMHRLAHGLSGAAGTFGLPLVSEAARALEQRLATLLKTGRAPDAAELQAIGADLRELERLARVSDAPHAPTLPPLSIPVHRDRAPLVHLVEDDPDQAQHLSQALREDGYRVRAFTSPAQFRAAFEEDEERPAAVVMDMVFPEGDDTGAILIAELGLKGESGIPVVVVSVRDDLPGRLAAFRAGACRYLTKPVARERLSEILDTLTSRQPSRPYRVLMVDDDPLLLDTHSTLLRLAGMEVHPLSAPMEILAALDEFKPDVVVLDVYMPEASGPELAAVLRERDEQMHLPILFLSSETDMSQQLLALNLGGDDFLVKPVQPDHLIAAVTARARRARQNSAIQRRLENTLYEREREHLALDQHAIVSIADAKGTILYVNDKFCEISGFTRGELVGQNHRIVKSGLHPPGFYQVMWHAITRGKVWRGEICNRRKDGGLYWAESTIVPFLDARGKPYQYVSVRTDITHVKDTEAALRASETRLNFLVATSPVTIYSCQVTPPYAATYVSPNVSHIMGIPPEQFTQDEAFWARNVHPEDQARVLAQIPLLFERGTLQDEYRFLLPDGSLHWLHDEMRLVRDEAGQPREIVGYWMDITKRKLAEQAAEMHKERLRRGQAFANIGTWEWNIQSGELFWTERIAPLFGHPVGELETSYENFLAAIHPDDRKMVLDAVNACVERDVPYDIEHRVVWPDGTVRWLLERGAVVRGADGQPQQMLGVVQDIDDRKRAELALAERERQLHEAQRLARIGNWTADFTSGKLTWSDEIYRIFGHAPGSFAPSVEAFKAAVHPDDRELVRASERHAEASGLHDVVHRIVRPDGTVRHVHELARAETDAAGGLLRLVGTVQDITEQVATEQALIVARDEADRANKAKSDFLSSMSHELRTPMNAILGFGQLMEYDEGLDAEQRENVQEILKAGNHLLELINEVLDLSKIESGNIDLSLEPVELCTVIEECLTLARVLADQHGIHLAHGKLRGASVRADRTRLKQALLNLLSNAIKYNHEGGTVTLDIQRQGQDRLRLLVSDTGFGIDAARHDELFQPFQRLSAENSNIEGTGIGLTITRRIVEMMGGTVDVESEVGVGSTFWIELPLEGLHCGPHADADGDWRAETAREALQASPRPAAKHTVLYIEDNPSNLRLVAQLLGRRPNVNLFTAHTPELGIDLARSRRPELILLDINMPGMDGYQVLEVLKINPDTRDIPVIAITANAMPRDIQLGRAAGFVDYLTKPLDIARFHQAVDACLEQLHPGATGGGQTG